MEIKKQNKGNVIEFNSCNMNELTYNSLSFNSSKFNSIGIDVKLNSNNEESEDVIATFDIFATYNVESTEERMTLLGNNFSLTNVKGMTIDGVEVKPTKKYKFATTGEHIVKFSIVKNITYTSYMFWNCNNLTTLDVSNFDTSNVTNMSYMFDGCNKLTTLDPFKQWRKATYLSLENTKITPLAVHQLIERASSVADGAVARTLKLSSTTKTNWQASEYYTADQAMATEKLITIQ
jgi:surface protein